MKDTMTNRSVTLKFDECVIEMYKVTVYADDGTIEDESTFSNFHAAFMYKMCAFRIGSKKVEMKVDEVKEHVR